MGHVGIFKDKVIFVTVHCTVLKQLTYDFRLNYDTALNRFYCLFPLLLSPLLKRLFITYEDFNFLLNLSSQCSMFFTEAVVV